MIRGFGFALVLPRFRCLQSNFFTDPILSFILRMIFISLLRIWFSPPLWGSRISSHSYGFGFFRTRTLTNTMVLITVSGVSRRRIAGLFGCRKWAGSWKLAKKDDTIKPQGTEPKRKYLCGPSIDRPSPLVLKFRHQSPHKLLCLFCN